MVAWNRAAATLLTDYSKLPPEERNVLRLMFTNPHTRSAQAEWLDVARYVVAAFRADAARAGAGEETARLVEELSQRSPEFAALWQENDVVSQDGGLKRLRHDRHGLIELEFSAFKVDGRPELGMIVYNPATEQAAIQIEEMLGQTA